MSTGMECRVFEVSPGEWFYLLQRDDCPAGAWNWTEHAYCGGPYPNADACFDAVRDTHGNPGGYFEDPLAPGQTAAELSDHVAAMVADARKRGRGRSRW